ncbi:PRD domain-containing protein [Peptacetobacter sp.]|uniref:PRD domain-containing protein n=1 Tax=Peptacetobacter sp. TaxID=2991975 RepID=UPI00261259A6|nr:PRD domain-containing protein [Peptacetobacter sp.]
MKSNKDMVYEHMQRISNKYYGKERKFFTTKELAEELEMQRSNISSILNTLVKERKVEKSSGRPVLYSIFNLEGKKEENSCFKKLIGYKSSLKNQVQLTKAALLYPENNLNTIIIGEPGCGKSYFASLMYEFAKNNNVIDKDSPFVVFNCKNYEGEESKIQEDLFGIKNYENSALYKANGGILLIDHINIFTAKERELLFKVLERIGNNKYKIMIICTADMDNKKTTLEEFASNFSVRINLPKLEERTMVERFNLVQKFLIKEASRMGRKIKIDSELLRSILLYKCDRNIKQLRDDIKFGCANAYVREHENSDEVIYLYIRDFPTNVRKGFLYYKEYREEIENLIPKNYSYTFSEENIEKEEYTKIIKNNKNINMYDMIDSKIIELKERGIDNEGITTIINADILSSFKNLTNKVQNSKIDKDYISKVVDIRIINLVEKFIKEASNRFDRIYPEAVFYSLCLHLSASLERDNSLQRLTNGQIMEVIENYREEYTFCMKFCVEIEKEFNVRLPIDEIVFITMFICENITTERNTNKPVVLVAIHGNSAASSIADVVNSITKNNNTYAYNLSFDKDMKTAYDEFKEVIQEIDNGKGIIMIYDMGSIKAMAEMISQETDIKIRMLEVPITLLAIDCSRRVNMTSSLEEAFEGMINSYHENYPMIKDSYERNKNNKVIVTLCMSGKGGAIQIKKYLETHLKEKNIDIIPLAINNSDYLLSELEKIRKKQTILYIIGTYDPQVYGIPFISVSKLFQTPVEKLDVLLALENVELSEAIDYKTIINYLGEQFKGVDMKLLEKDLLESMKKIKKISNGLTIDQEIGLFMHIACTVNRMINKEKMYANIHKAKILSKNKQIYNQLKEILEEIEIDFNILFNDDELANIISLIKQI